MFKGFFWLEAVASGTKWSVHHFVYNFSHWRPGRDFHVGQPGGMDTVSQESISIWKKTNIDIWHSCRTQRMLTLAIYGATKPNIYIYIHVLILCFHEWSFVGPVDPLLLNGLCFFAVGARQQVW